MSLDVLIIDDDAVVLFLHKNLVKKTMEFREIREFSNATSALQYLDNRKNSTPTLILLDINMPLISGWEFLDNLQKQNEHENLFVVMVTSSINSSDRKMAEAYPLVIDYQEKPLSRVACSALFEKIKDLL